MDNIFVGRQPIYDRELNVVAYELLFRGGNVDASQFQDGDLATCSVLSNTLVEIGIENVCGSKLAFINFTRGFLDGRYPLPVDMERIVVEILETEVIDDALLEAVGLLKTLGVQIALDDFELTDETRPLVELADIIKLDLRAQDSVKLKKTVRQLQKACKARLLAEKIETCEEFEFCMKLGFELFQGYFLSRPRVISGHQIPKNRLAIMQLLSRLQDPQVEISELTQFLAQDVALTMRLLQMVNTSAMGLSKRIESVQHAVVMLGTARVRNLASLALLTAMNDTPPALLSLALLRAKMCEHLGKQMRIKTDAFFTVGLLSALDLFMQRPLEEVLQSIPLHEELSCALLHGEGRLGAALQCALAFERGEGENAKCLILTKEAIQQAYLDALKDVENSASLLDGKSPEAKPGAVPAGAL